VCLCMGWNRIMNSITIVLPNSLMALWEGCLATPLFRPLGDTMHVLLDSDLIVVGTTLIDCVAMGYV
jgi:hypothetical protein